LTKIEGKSSQIQLFRSRLSILGQAPQDRGIPYEFKNPYQLLQDFFEKVDEIINNDQES